jgi:hypothetical protein
VRSDRRRRRPRAHAQDPVRIRAALDRQRRQQVQERAALQVVRELGARRDVEEVRLARPDEQTRPPERGSVGRDVPERIRPVGVCIREAPERTPERSRCEPGRERRGGERGDKCRSQPETHRAADYKRPSTVV